MQPDLIREIAESIVRDQILLNWHFYALISGLSFVAGAAGHFLASYFKKRGETLATRADMQEILQQVSETTRATEEVRSTISQADWAAREWRTTRRLKLEELLSSAYSLDQWLDLQRSRWMFGEAPATDTAPMERIKLLATLYFPEIQAEAAAVCCAHQGAFLFILEFGKRTDATRNGMDINAHRAVLNEFMEGWKPLYESSCLAIVALENKASSLMTEVAGV